MSDIDNSLCIRCEWQEDAPHENCKDCADHEAGVCLMAEAYQQGREDAIAEMSRKIMEYINTSNRGNCDYFIVDQIENYIAEKRQKDE